MKTKVKALTMFVHGRTDAVSGETYELSKSDADELIAAGLVEQVKEPAKKEAEVEDKEAAPVENKMEEAPENKAPRKTTKAK